MEPKLWATILALFRSDLVPPGYFLEAGCHEGEDIVALARELPNRTIVAIEPIRANVEAAKRRIVRKQQVQVLHGVRASAFDHESTFTVDGRRAFSNTPPRGFRACVLIGCCTLIQALDRTKGVGAYD